MKNKLIHLQLLPYSLFNTYSECSSNNQFFKLFSQFIIFISPQIPLIDQMKNNNHQLK